MGNIKTFRIFKPIQKAIPSSIRHAMMGDTPKGLALRGSMWTFGGFGATQVLRLCSNLVLTRLLIPGDFGMMALVNIIIAGIAMFSDIGLRGSIIYHKRGEDPSFLNTAWTLQIIRSGVVALIACALAYPMSLFYNQPYLLKLIPVVSVTALIGGLTSTNVLLAMRQVAISRVTMLEVASSLSGIVVMIGWALIHPTIWALVGGSIFGVIVRVVLSHTILIGPRNRIQWDKEAAASMIKFGRWVVISSFATYAASNFDRLLLGHYVTMGVLGVYSISMTLSTVPQMIIVKFSSSILRPTYARYAREDHGLYVRKIRESQQFLLPVVLWVCLALVTLSPPFFIYLYDVRYHEAGWMGQLMSVTIWFYILQILMTQMILAIGKSSIVAVSNFANALVTVVMCVIGYKFGGIVGLILGSASGNLAGYLVLEYYLSGQQVRIAVMNMKYSLMFLSLAALIGGGPLWIEKLPGMPDRTLLTLCVGLCVLLPMGALSGRRIYNRIVDKRQTQVANPVAGKSE